MFAHPYQNTPALTEDELEIIRSTVPVLAQHGVALTKLFYSQVFAAVPSLKNIFNQAHQATDMQPKALAAAVYAYAANIDDLRPILPAVRLMAHRHVSLSVLPEHYPIVGKHLLAALDQLLTSAGFPADKVAAIISAWATAYGQLARILIEEEEKLYAAAESTPGGWRGWRKFVLEKRTREAESGIDSFVWRPVDGKPVPVAQPGQFTTLRLKVPGRTADEESFFQPRQYTLSAPNDGATFRITVKREDAVSMCPMGKAAFDAEAKRSDEHKSDASKDAAKVCPHLAGRPAGVVSQILHTLPVGSEVEFAPPFGDFVLEASEAPVVLISAGVGITPCVPMLEEALACKRSVSFLYSCASGSHHPFRSWLREQTARAGSDLRAHVWYTRPEASDELGSDYHSAGRMALTRELASLLRLDQPSAAYFVCGPDAFMSDVLAVLKSLGVSEMRMHAERFASGGVSMPPVAAAAAAAPSPSPAPVSAPVSAPASSPSPEAVPSPESPMAGVACDSKQRRVSALKPYASSFAAFALGVASASAAALLMWRRSSPAVPQ